MASAVNQIPLCFQELWRIVVGKSSIKDLNSVGSKLAKHTSSLEKCLKYFKPNTQEARTRLKNDKDVSEDWKNLSMKISEFLNLDAVQAYHTASQFATFEFRGSKEKFSKTLSEERNHLSLLGRIAEFYFSERLYLLRVLKHVLSHFEDQDHKYQREYAEVVNAIKANIADEVFKQYEKEFLSEIPKAETRGKSFTQQVVIPFAMQAIKEQREMLEILFVYYSHFEMKPDVLLKYIKSFKEQGFGAGHPLLEAIDASVLNESLTRLNALQQLIVIEGFDMEYLQRLTEADSVGEHKMSVNKREFEELDKVFCALTVPCMAPLLLAWTTIRYQVLSEDDSDVTQKLGERVIEHKVWHRINSIIDMYPPENNCSAAKTIREVLRRLLSCVTHSFHEETLGDHGELVEAVTKVLEHSETVAESFWEDRKRGNGLHLLLLSAAGYFPLHITPLMKFLVSVSSGAKSSYEVFSFVGCLPYVSEYLTARGTEDVESIDDGSYWRLLAGKNVSIAGGYHHIKISAGSVGQLIDSQIGAIVQWQSEADGWKAFRSEIENVLRYRGQSSDLEVLGYVDLAAMVYGIVERVLVHVPKYEDEAKKERVLDCLEPFIEKVFPLIQRLISMVNPPLDLFALCIQCVTGFLKCDSRQTQAPNLLAPLLQNHRILMAVVNGMVRVQFLPFSDHNFLENLESAAKLPLHYVSKLPATIHQGLYGQLLTNVERPIGRYSITVAMLDFILAVVETTVSWRYEDFLDEDEHNLKVLISHIAPSVLFFLKEIFPTFDQWRFDPDTTDRIGLKCLNLCHMVLRTYNPGSDAATLWSPIQHTILTILTHSHSVDIILKLISTPVEHLHALIASGPTSISAQHMTEAIRYGFSVLNNILRLEHDALSSQKAAASPKNSSEDGMRSSHLHAILAAPVSVGPNLVSLVSGYLYHRYDQSLPCMALSLLRRISIAVPMSLHASLGQDVSSLRDILLFRLRSKIEGSDLKIGILEFLTISVQTQPGLLELFLDLEAVDKDKPEEGLCLGERSCLSAVLELIDKETQGTRSLSAPLQAACVKFLSSLWVDRRHSALKALRTYSASGKLKTSFWHSLLLPLFSENPPREIAQSDLLETAAHILNTLGLENFYTTPSGKDPALEPIMKEFAAKDRYNHWSKVLVCVCKTLPRLNSIDTTSRLMFLTAWRIFVLTSKLHDTARLRKYVDDIMMAVNALVEDIEAHSGMATALNLTSSLLLTLLNRAPEDTLTDYDATMKTFSDIVRNTEKVESRVDSEHAVLYFRTISIHLFKTLHKKLRKGKMEFNRSVSDWLRLSCKTLRKYHSERPDDDINSKANIETSRLLVQSIREVFSAYGSEPETLSCWLKMLMEECTLNLLSSRLLRLMGSTHEDDDKNGLRASLATAILNLFCDFSRHYDPAFALLKTGTLPEFCLKSVNTYTDAVAAQKKKWNGVYQLSIVLVQNMLDSLGHAFLEHALDFIGVHNDRIIQCLEAVNFHQSTAVLQEATFTTALLSSVSKSFVREWRFKLPRLYQVCLENVLALCHSCVAMLLRPRLLQEALEMSLTSKKQSNTPIPPSLATQHSLRQTSVMSQKTLSQDEVEDPTPKFLAVRRGLFAILANCLAIFGHLSPDLCQILLDQGVDAEEYQPLLAVAFSTPSLDQVSMPTFGTVINAFNVAWKVISQTNNSPDLVGVATYALDAALLVAISQGTLLLKHPQVSHRDKQRLRRELGDELVACLRTANRHSRLSGGSVTSPHSSPSDSRTPLKARSALLKQFSNTAAQRQHSVSIDRGMLDLVDLFVKGVLR